MRRRDGAYPACFLSVLAALPLFFGPGVSVRAAGRDQPVQKARDEEKRLPGHAMQVREALRRADVIAVARFTDLGVIGLDAPGQSRHQGVKVEIMRSLKGKADGELCLFFKRMGLSKDTAESTPEKGREYLIFVTSGGTEGPEAIKILSATKDHLRSVTEMLDEASKSH